MPWSQRTDTLAHPPLRHVAIARIALLGTLAGSLVAALSDETSREPALTAFLVTASGLTLAGIGAAFWGLVAGGIALAVLRRRG